MRRLRIFEHISLDGVIQIRAAAEENDFPYGDWTAPYRGPAGRDLLLGLQGEGFDLLLGRHTYDLWSRYWPLQPSGPLSDGLNAATKFVATHRPEGLEWGPVRAIGPDVVADVRRIRSADGPDVLVWGSSTLTSTLLEHGLADELVLFVYPVLLGAGKRVFADGTPPRAFELASSQALPSGIVVQRYEAAGGLKNRS